MNLRTAILVDGSFFIRRVNFFFRKYFKSQGELAAQQLVDILLGLQRKHLSSASNSPNKYYLYRVFFYDCEPLDFSIHYPVPYIGEDRCRMINFSKIPVNECRQEFLRLLKKQRKVALRLGQIKHHKRWSLKNKVTKELLSGELTPSELSPEHFYFESEQKGVDTKLGIDIASLAYEGHVDQIILIAGDSDFVPASKLARRKGIDFVLDCLRNNIDPQLDEHIDGLTSYDLVSIISDVIGVSPDIKPTWWDSEKPKPKKSSKKK